MQSECILATGAPDVPDPRLAGPDAGVLAVSELFDAEDEPLREVGGGVRCAHRVDSDEDLCALVVVGYPNYARVELVEEYFRNVGSLRKAAERLPGRTTERVRVTFETEQEARFAMEWFRNPKRAMVAGHVVAVERVKERKADD